MPESNPTVEVEAQTIDTALTSAEGFIEQARGVVDAKLDEYKALTCIEGVEQAKQARKYRADINATIKRIKAAKEERIGELRRAIKTIDAAVADVLSPLDERQKEIAAMMGEFAEENRAERYAWLEEHYLEAYPLLAEVLPFARLDQMHRTGESSFYGSRVSDAKARELLDAHVDRIAADEAALANMAEQYGMDDDESEQLRADYFATLSIAEAARLAEERRGRMAADAQARAAVREMDRKRQVDRILQTATTTVSVAELAQADQALASSLAEKYPEDPHQATIDVEGSPKEEQPHRWRVAGEGEVVATRSRLQKILATIKSLGLHGKASKIEE